jgi:hypothetical protein
MHKIKASTEPKVKPPNLSLYISIYVLIEKQKKDLYIYIYQI